MRARDVGILTALSGALALEVGVTDTILVFLRPSMRTYLVASGAVLVVAGLAQVIVDWRGSQRAAQRGDAHAHGHGTRVGWLLIVPLLVAVIVAPGTLGSWAVAHQQGTQAVPRMNFDVAAFLRTQSLVGNAPQMRLYDFFNAAGGDARQRNALGGTDVKLTGFVTPIKGATDRFMLNRFLISCCVADATLLQVEVRVAEPPATDAWVEATVRFLPDQTPPVAAEDSSGVPVTRLVALRPIRRPREPYEFVYQ